MTRLISTNFWLLDEGYTYRLIFLEILEHLQSNVDKKEATVRSQGMAWAISHISKSEGLQLDPGPNTPAQVQT